MRSATDHVLASGRIPIGNTISGPDTTTARHELSFHGNTDDGRLPVSPQTCRGTAIARRANARDLQRGPHFDVRHERGTLRLER
jgi:hypothetical protein